MLPTICRTFIFEDSYFDMEAIKSILLKIHEVQIVGEAAMVGEALEICRRRQPHLIIADGSIHDDKTVGPNFVRNVRKELPDVRILGLTRFPDMVEVLKRAGCDFVVNKSVIENHAAAVKYIKETLLPRPQFAVPLKPPELTAEEGKVLKMICDGKTEHQMAAALGHSTRKPVRSLKNNLFRKFGATSVAQLVHLAYKTGYLDPGEE